MGTITAYVIKLGGGGLSSATSPLTSKSSPQCMQMSLPAPRAHRASHVSSSTRKGKELNCRMRNFNWSKKKWPESTPVPEWKEEQMRF